jgi:DNA-binding beta-propeller fold protein YncE
MLQRSQFGRRLMIAMAAVWAVALACAPGAWAAGGLSFVACVQAPPASACGGPKNAVGELKGVDDVVVTPDGKQAYATAFRADALLQFRRGASGALTSEGGALFDIGGGLRMPTSVVVSPDGRNVYVTFSNPGAIVVLKRTPHLLGESQCIAETGSHVCGQTAPGLGGAFDVAISPDGRTVYVASTASSALAVFRRGANGELSFEECISDAAPGAEDCSGSGGSVPGLAGAIGVAVDPSGRNVYVTGSGSDALVEFSRDPQDGSLNPLGCIENTGSTGCVASGPPVPKATPLAPQLTSGGLGFPALIAVSHDGTNVYITSAKPGAVAGFHRDRASGMLTPIGCIGASSAARCGPVVPALTDAYGVALSADDRSLYATATVDGAVVTFSRSGGGGLSYRACLSGSRVCADRHASLAGAAGLAASPDGRDVYVAGFGAGAVVQLTGSRPALTDLRLEPSAFHAAKRGPSVTAPGRGKPVTGAMVSYVDTVWSRTRFTVEQAVPGIRRGNRCVRAAGGAAHGSSCRLLVRVGSFTRSDETGSNRFRFTGRVAGATLAAGNYVLVAAAQDAAGTGRGVSVAFRVL